MSECLQTEGQTILQHGESVWEHTKKLICGNFEGFVLPEWFKQNHHFIVNNLHEWEIIKKYNIYHDCGKPRCLDFDLEGRRHFPNHAEHSKSQWLELFPDDTIVSDLIGLDMMFHTEKTENILAKNLSTQTLLTLMITAFAEIHSNAKMFGGIESVSFKIKYKALEKRAKKVFSSLGIGHEDLYSYVIVRNDLPNSQKAVQSIHAAIEMKLPIHPSIICVVVKDEKKLKKVLGELIEQNIKCSIFREPMPPFDNTITAICTEPLSGDKRNYLRRFQLLYGQG